MILKDRYKAVTNSAFTVKACSTAGSQEQEEADLFEHYPFPTQEVSQCAGG